MFKSIVVGTDGSETADIALRRAIELAALTGGKLHVVSAYEPAPARVGGNRPVAEASEWTVGSDFKVEAVLQRAQDEANAGSVDYEVHAPKGDAADSLIAAAKEHDALPRHARIVDGVEHRAGVARRLRAEVGVGRHAATRHRPHPRQHGLRARVVDVDRPPDAGDCGTGTPGSRRG